MAPEAGLIMIEDDIKLIRGRTFHERKSFMITKINKPDCQMLRGR